jgi:adenylate kinase
MSPKVEGKCDKCGGDLIQRIDDNPKMIKTRLDIYREQSTPVAQYYRGRIQFIDLNMTGAVHLMVNLIMEKLTIVIKNQESL